MYDIFLVALLVFLRPVFYLIGWLGVLLVWFYIAYLVFFAW